MSECHYCPNKAKHKLVWLKDKYCLPARIELPWCGCDLQVALRKFWSSPYKVIEGDDYVVEPLEQEMSYTFDEYQNTTHQTSVYPSDESQETESVTYLTLGLVGESGEVAEKIKKALRDDGGVITPERKALLHKELGDILWYHSELCSRLGFDMGEVAKANIDKLLDRKARGVLHGSGDNR